MEKLIERFKQEMERYENEYRVEYDAPEVNREHKRVVAEAATSYVNGVLIATLWGFG